MEVSDGEFRAWDMNGEVDLGTARKVFDVAVSSVFRTALRLLSIYFQWI